MQKAKLVKREKGLAFYKIAGHAALTDKLIESLDWPANIKRLVFDFKPVAPSSGFLSPKISNKYSARIMYLASKGDIKLPAGARNVGGLRLVPAKDLRIFRKGMERAFMEYVRPIKSYVTPEFMKRSDEFMEKQLKRCRNLWLEKDGRNVGLVSILAYREGGRPGTLVAQIWIDPKLPPALRRDAKAVISGWLRKNVKSRMITGEHAKSVKSQKFFSSMGFKAGRCSVERR
ncbi:MAG: hypothetical protein FD189_2150 [Elusimicrobia bacterium]|nr:MAG: hypothetical protein FD154_2164 [Elusimicrobiota bacterium]KAF0153979.1 MAG: hypothetical protein FD189_2150 [Elusimicrobiota bacterium]